MDLAERAGEFAGLFSFLGLIMLVPLCISQRRDLHRLRAWKLRVPNLQAAEFQAVEATSEFTAIVTETGEIEVTARITQEHDIPSEFESEEQEMTPDGTFIQPEPIGAWAPGTPARGQTPIPPARRIALDRPATARITLDHPALDPPPGVFGRFGSWRILVPMVVAFLGAGVGLTLLALEISENEPSKSPPTTTPAVDPSEVEVAVLNGTAIPDLANKVGDDLEAIGFVRGLIGNSQNPYERSVVMYASGNREEADAVAASIGIDKVIPIDADASRDSEGAEVVVIAGEERAR